MSRFIRRFRLLLPASSYIVAYVAIYLAACLPMLIAPQGFNNRPFDPVLRYPPIFVHLLGMFAYGVYRAVGFHPFFREDYRRWLETTPWALGKPLPVGPAQLVWEDVVVIALAGLPEWLSGDVPPLASYAAALCGYVLWLCFSFGSTGSWGYQFVATFGVVLAIRLCHEPSEYYGGAAILSYIVALMGLRRSLRHWPWPDVKSIEPAQAAVAARAALLGWPYDRLGPRVEPPSTRRDALERFLNALLAGWWCYAIEHIYPDNAGFIPMRGLTMNLIFFMIAVRTATTVAGFAPPISLAGRLGRFRPLVPSYDQIFITPIASLFAIAAGPSLLEYAGTPRDIAIAASTSMALAALWLGGPDRRTWQLTAKHRITAGLSSNAGKAGEFVQTG